MTKEEFEAMLAVDGYEYYQSVLFGFGHADDTFVARIIEPIHADDTSQGPYRLPGMMRTVLETQSDVSNGDALEKLIQLYSEGRTMK